MKFFLIIILLFLMLAKYFDYKNDKRENNKSLKQREKEWMQSKIKGPDSFLL